MSHHDLSRKQWTSIIQFLRLPEMVYTCMQLRCSCKKNQPAREYLFGLKRDSFFWYVNSDDDETLSISSISDCGDEIPNSQNVLRTIHFCEEIEEVSANAVKEINCETVLQDLQHTLHQLQQHGCPMQERVVWQEDDEDTSVYTRHLGFRVEKQLHLTPIIDVTWQCNTSAGKWFTFVSGFMACSLLDKVLSSLLSGGDVSVQGEGGARRLTDTAFSWQYEHKLHFKITQTCTKTEFL